MPGMSMPPAISPVAVSGHSSATCLNGHVHQLFTKVEGNVTFYSATTTAYPLPHPGVGPGPIPMMLRLAAALAAGALVVHPLPTPPGSSGSSNTACNPPRKP
jgi:hypothetical protein